MQLPRQKKLNCDEEHFAVLIPPVQFLDWRFLCAGVIPALSDKETAKKQLMDSFGMTAAKAERIIDKAKKQTIVNNLLKKAKAKAALTADAIKHKKLDRGSRK
mgnify:CR=1 FL=1